MLAGISTTKIIWFHKNITKLFIGRVCNPKNQLLQIDSSTIVGCSLGYPIARTECTIVVFTEISLFVSQEMQNLFLNIGAPRIGPDGNLLLSQILSRVVVKMYAW